MSHLFENICVTMLLFNSSIVTHKINTMRCQVSRNSHKVLEHTEVVDMYIIQTNNKKHTMENTSAPFMTSLFTGILSWINKTNHTTHQILYYILLPKSTGAESSLVISCQSRRSIGPSLDQLL